MGKVAVGKGFGLPDGNDGWSDWTWFHARSGVVQTFTVLCEEPVNYAGHYSKGRMVPCLGEVCPLCARGLGSQARYVLSVVDWESRRVGLLELGRGHILSVKDWADSFGGLRGLSFTVERATHSKQSRMELRLQTEEVPPYFKHLEGPDLARAVASTWERQVSITLEDSLPGRPRKSAAG